MERRERSEATGMRWRIGEENLGEKGKKSRLGCGVGEWGSGGELGAEGGDEDDGDFF